MMKIRIALLTMLGAAFLSFSAYGCGDSLYRVGKGVSYRVYSAPLPANLLVYADSDSATQLAGELAKSGHGVQVVASAEDLAAELEAGGYDVVIAPFGHREAVEAMTGDTTSSDTAFLPIAMNGAEERQAKDAYSQVMVAAKHEIKHYLKAIHRTLKDQA